MINRFKKQLFIATTSLLKERYIIKNAKRNREFREYAQKVIRLAKFEKMNSIFNQFNIIYNDIDVKLRRDFKRPFNTSTVENFLQNLDDCKNI